MNLKRYTWNHFCENTTIHGLLQIFVQKMYKHHRLFWIALAIVLISLSTSEIVGSVQRYLKKDIMTLQQVENVATIEFPSITFCNTNTGLRSVMGSAPGLLLLMRIFIMQNISSAMETLAIEGQKNYCETNETSLFSELSILSLNTMDIRDILSKASPSSRTSSLKCWWDEEEKNCADLFVDHLTDLGWCFTFNPSKTLRAKIHKNMNGTKYSEMISKKRGKRSGLRLLLNTDQPNYCSTLRKYIGAGFKIIVHNPIDSEPSFEWFPMRAPLLLTPGFETSLILKPTKFHRLTERLGKCFKPMFRENGTKVYNQVLCMMYCNGLKMYDKCGCFPNWSFGREEFISDNSGIPLEKIKFCQTTSEMSCFVATVQEITHFADKCPYCKTYPCDETKYLYQKLSNSYLSPTFARTSLDMSNITEPFVRKNLILFNVFFDDQSVTKVIEQQDFDTIDMLIYIGGILGLFLGMSFTTFFEIFFQLHVSLIMLGYKLFSFIHPSTIETVKSVNGRLHKYSKRGSICHVYLPKRN